MNFSAGFRIILVLIGMIAMSSSGFGQDEPRAQGYEADDPIEISGLARGLRFRAFLPPFHDLSAAFPRPGDQGKQGACVAWSVGYALRGYYHHQRTGTSYADRSNLFSPAYIYNQLVSTPDCASGSSIRKALTLMQSEGVATLADFPYDDRSCVRKPPDEVKRRAAEHTIASFRAIGQADLPVFDDIKGSIRSGHPVVVGLNIDGKSLTSLRAGQIYDHDKPLKFSGHAVVLTGFDDRTQTFKFINSWGTNWADGGFGRISYRSFALSAHAAFVADDGLGAMPAVQDVRPQPPPPEPAPQNSAGVAALVRALEAKARTFQCALVSIKAAGSNEAILRGWVSGQADLDELAAITRSSPAGAHIDQQVRLRPWPQCEVMLTLSEVLKGNRGASITMVGHTGTDLEAGGNLAMKVKTPDFPSYVYVTYLPASGDAVSLFKPRGIVPQPSPPGSVIDLGGGADPRVFRVGPPFGPEMVLAIASASPLFADGLPATTTERDYLTAMRKALLYKPDPNQSDRVVDAGFLFLTTHDRARAP